MKKAVVTFTTDRNDYLYPPVFDFTGVDFLCFTDSFEVKSRFWKVVPFDGFTIEDIKNVTSEYFKEYDEVIFVDTNDVVTMNSEGDIKIVKGSDLTGCVDEKYLEQVRKTSVKNSDNVSETVESISGIQTDIKCMYPLKLTIGMLIGAKSPYIDKCLDSVKCIMKSIPESEFIVVDTGNKDGSIDRIRALAEILDNIIIIPFTWVHDFSLARNVAVTSARGNWYMTLDDDEWFEDIGPLVEFFSSDKNLCNKYEYAMYTQRNYMDEGGQTYVDASVVRLAKNRPDLRYRRRIHENFNFKETEIDPYPIDAYVHHYGYLCEDGVRAAKSQRNMALLMLETEDNPADTHVLVEMMQEFLFLQRYDLLYEYALKGLALSRNGIISDAEIFIAMLVKALAVIDKQEIFNYEKRYIKGVELGYIETAYIAYEVVKTASEFIKKQESNSINVRKYIEKVIEYSNYFEEAFWGYNRAQKGEQLAMATGICDNYCNRYGFLMDVLIMRALALDIKRDGKSVVRAVKSVRPEYVRLYSMEYYSLVVKYGVGTYEFYQNNSNVPGIWMLFVQALLQNPELCVSLLKSIPTEELDLLVEGANKYIADEQRATFNRVFEELIILRLVCEYIAAKDYGTAINALKIALQGSAQARAVAKLLLESMR